MCFSAPASFTAAAVLAAVGAASLAQKPPPRFLLFASFPLVFAAHQAIEGFIWLSIGKGAAPPDALIIAYLIIAQVAWPTLTPLAMLSIETGRRRRQALFALLAAGLIVSLTMAQILATHPYTVALTAHGLSYATAGGVETQIVGLYALTTAAPLLISRHRFILAFGIAVLIGAVVTEVAFFQAAASVWCFFAALASAFVFLQAREARRRARATR